MTHTKQLLLVTFCHTTSGIGASFQTHRQNENGNGWTDRRGSRNSYLDVEVILMFVFQIFMIHRKSGKRKRSPDAFFISAILVHLLGE